MNHFRLSFLLCLTLLSACAGNLPVLGIQNGVLSECPSSPNCVSSQAKDDSHYLEPILVERSQETARESVLEVLNEMGAEVVTSNDDYIRAAFSSRLFGFVDDVEFYLNALSDRQTRIHVRSASRIGYSDFGVNRARIETIRERLNLVQ